MDATPQPLTEHPAPSTPTDPGPWTYELVDRAFEHARRLPYGNALSCETCGAGREDTYYLDDYGGAGCAACAATCPYCYEAPAVVSARRTPDDPSAPGKIDHVCEGCLVEHWAPGDTLRAAEVAS